MVKNSALAALLAAASASVGYAQSDGLKLPSAAPPDAPAESARSGSVLEIAGLGFRDGLDFEGLEGRRSLFFPVPDGPWLRGMRLYLPYEAVANEAADGRRTITLSVAGRAVRQFAVANGAGIIEFPIPAEAVRGGFVHVGLSYSGALTRDRCFDRRWAADRIHFDPAGGLKLDLAPGRPIPAGLAASLLPREVMIWLPANPNPAQAAAALTMVAAQGGGSTAFGTPPSTDPARSWVSIGGAGEPALRVLFRAGAPGLAIGGRDPAASARGIAANGSVASGGLATGANREKRTGSLRFADLGADQRAIDIAETGGWSFALPASRLPAGRSVRAISVDIASVPDGSGKAAYASVWMNGTLLATRALAENGFTHLDARVPAGLLQTLNGIEVRITRQLRDHCGEPPRGWPAQLLGSSQILLGDAPAMDDFHHFATAASDGLTVVLPDARSLNLAARAVAGLVGRDSPIAVSYGAMPASGPVLYVGMAAPPGTAGAMTFNGARVSVAPQNGETVFLDGGGDQVTAQLLEAGGRPILWVRPAPDGIVPASMWLDRGDVALVAADGRITPFTTRRERLIDFTPPRVETDSILPAGFWLWVVGGLLVLAAILGWSFLPSVRRARHSGDKA